MDKVAANSTCPSCGAPVEAAVAGGLCPACLLKQVAWGTGTGSEPSSPWTPPAVEALTAVLPQLEIVELIGHGGMGAVYKARQKSLGRLVALKILAPHQAANPDFAERFAREAKTLAEVNHPNIVTVYDFGRAGEFYYLTMEFVDGVNLRQALAAGRLTPQQALAIVPPICEALQFAHEHGIVHRDIKPENLLLDKDGRIKIADFGIARMMRGTGTSETQRTAGAREAGHSALRTDGELTVVDLTQQSVLGTPQYMAPEQWHAPSAVDHRADIYSLGVVLYEMLTGELPGAKLEPPSKKVQIDVRLDEIVLRALEHEPELRFQTAAEFRTRVTAFVTGESTIAEAAARSPTSPAIAIKVSPRLLVFCSTLVGFALSLKPASTLPLERALMALFACTGAAFAWGCLLAWMLGRSARAAVTENQSGPPPTKPAAKLLWGVGLLLLAGIGWLVVTRLWQRDRGSWESGPPLEVSIQNVACGTRDSTEGEVALLKFDIDVTGSPLPGQLRLCYRGDEIPQAGPLPGILESAQSATALRQSVKGLFLTPSELRPLPALLVEGINQITFSPSPGQLFETRVGARYRVELLLPKSLAKDAPDLLQASGFEQRVSSSETSLRTLPRAAGSRLTLFDTSRLSPGKPRPRYECWLEIPAGATASGGVADPSPQAKRFGALFIGVGLLIAALSVPLILRRVPMNKLYGVRIPAAFESAEQWYAINEHGGWGLLAASLVITAAGGIGFGVTAGGLGTYVLGAFAVILLSVIAAALYTFCAGGAGPDAVQRRVLGVFCWILAITVPLVGLYFHNAEVARNAALHHQQIQELAQEIARTHLASQIANVKAAEARRRAPTDATGRAVESAAYQRWRDEHQALLNEAQSLSQRQIELSAGGRDLQAWHVWLILLAAVPFVRLGLTLAPQVGLWALVLAPGLLALLFFASRSEPRSGDPTRYLPQAVEVPYVVPNGGTIGPNGATDEAGERTSTHPVVKIPDEQLPVSAQALELGRPVRDFDVRSATSFPQLAPLVRLSAEEKQRQARRFDEAWCLLNAVTVKDCESTARKMMAHAQPLHPVYRASLLNTLIWRTHESQIGDQSMCERIIVEATLAALDESPLEAGTSRETGATSETISHGGPNSIPLGAALRMLERGSSNPQSLAKSEASFDWPGKRCRIAELWLTHLSRLPEIIDSDWKWLPVIINNGQEGVLSPETRREREAQELQNARNNERNGQQRAARELWKHGRPQLRRFLRLAYTLPPENTAEQDEFLRRESELKSPLPAEPPGEILGSNCWSIDVPNKNAELLAGMQDWVIAWDVQADAQSGGRRDAKLRIFPAGRVAVVSGLGAPLTEIQISPDEVQTLVDLLKQQGTERPSEAQPAAGRVAGDPLPPALWNQQAQRVAVRHDGKTFDLLTINALYETLREPWSREPVNEISGKAEEHLLRVFHLAAIGGPTAAEKYAALADAELRRTIPASPMHLTREHFSAAGHNPDGTLVVGFHFAPEDGQPRYPWGDMTIRVPQGGEPFIYEAHYWTGDAEEKRWGRRFETPANPDSTRPEVPDQQTAEPREAP